jgi:hypothetical protein
MDSTSRVADVKTFDTSRGNARYVVRDSDGNEYTTFREEIGRRAQELKGQRVRLTYHETLRGQYQNVYLDGVEPLEPVEGERSDTDAEEAAWRTAVEAAPWLVGQADGDVTPDELYKRLKPFEERVAEDIRREHDG